MSKKMPPLYRDILRQAWSITWHQKFMWVLGLFSAFVATGGAVEVLSRNLRLAFNPQPWSMNFTQGYWHWDLPAVIWGIVLLLLLLGLAAVFIFAVIRSFSTLIKTVDVYKEGSKVDLEKVWHKTHKNFWPVLGTVVIFKILEFGFICLSVLPLWGFILGYLNSAWLWVYPVVFLICVIASLACSLLVVLTSAFIVVDNEKIGSAIKLAIVLVFKHWLVSLEMSVFIFVINLLFSLAIVFALVLVAIPVVVVFVLSYFIGVPILAATGIFLGFLFGMMLILWMAGFLGTFHTTAWTLLFKRMSSGNAVSKLIRLSHHLFGRA